MHRFTTHAWRIALAASGAALLTGGSRHPESDAKESLRQELATMTSHEDWWLAHSFVVASAVLLAIGLWLAHRQRRWPTKLRGTLFAAAVAVSLYVVETVFHLAAAVDSDALRNGDTAPVAFTHIGLAIVLYPVAGIALAVLSARIFTVVDLPRKPIALIGIAAGVSHALSVPLTVALPDTEFSPVFAGSAVLLAIWSVGLGIAGFGRAVTTQPPASAAPVLSTETTSFPEFQPVR